MSGRDHEPVAAFFPSIDRNLIRDLDRHLRGGRPATEPTFAPEPFEPTTAPAPALAPALPRQTTRPNIASVVEAVEQAAQSIAAMTARVEELEGHINLLESNNRQLETQLDEAGESVRVLEGKLKAEGERAGHLETRTLDLERELSSVHGDLAHVTEAIAAALGLPQE